MVHTIRAHRDIVRDVAWHPSRNEILSSSWDYNVSLHVYMQSKRSLLKRSVKDVDGVQNDESSGKEHVEGPPPRRSRRLALRRQAQETN